MKNEIIEILPAANKKQLDRGEGVYLGFKQL